MATRNVTLSLPDDIFRRAKVLAAQRDTSVSALVAGLLEQAVGSGDDYAATWQAEEDLMSRGIGLEIGDMNWTREELHNR